MNIAIPELKEFINRDLPKPKKRETTIFDIAKFPHYENVMSSCYAYFLSQQEEHNLADIFLYTLLQLVAQKSGKQLHLDTWRVKSEEVTKTQKRIDLLIYGTGDDEGKYVIIENKIYHWLHNDLMDYWNHCDEQDANKIGVILSLTKVQVPKGLSSKFVNILHSEWNNAIRHTPSQANLPAKLQVYLDDFCTALDNLKHDTIMDNQARFFFDNLEKVNAVEQTKTAARTYVYRSLKAAAENLGLTHASQADFYNVLKVPALRDGSLYYTITFDNLFTTQRSIRILVEFRERHRKFVSELDEAIDQRYKQPPYIFKPKEMPGNWLQYVGRDYHITSMEDFDKQIAAIILLDFADLMKTITNILAKDEQKIPSI